MKTLATLTLAALVAIAAPSQAQEPGDAGIFADEAGTQTTLDVAPSVPFSVYAVLFDVPGGLKAYELSISGVQELGLFQTGATLFGPAPLNIGDAAVQNFIVGTGGCVDELGPLPLVRLDLLALTAPPADSPICIGPSVPSSFDAVPGYSDCANQIAPFGVATDGGAEYADGCLILNATSTGPVDNETSSFGEVKARF